MSHQQDVDDVRALDALFRRWERSRRLDDLEEYVMALRAMAARLGIVPDVALVALDRIGDAA